MVGSRPSRAWGRGFHFFFWWALSAIARTDRAPTSFLVADVVDDEEDEDWKAWGRKPEKKKEPLDLNNMSKEQLMMMSGGGGGSGPQMVFIHLRDDPKRTKDDAEELARRWDQLLKTAALADEKVR